MSEEVSVEGTGETVGEAKWAAVRELERLLPGLDRASIRFQVVSEGERGLLGVGYAPARVLATADQTQAVAAAAAAREESAEAVTVRELLERLIAVAGAACTVRIEENGGQITAVLSGPDLGILIGWHGQTIDAVQYLANAIGYRSQGPERKRVVVDAAGYRARRTAALEVLAQRSAERASGTGRRVQLEPMSAVERKIVHEFLKEDPEVETISEGTEPYRCVVVIPRRRA